MWVRRGSPEIRALQREKRWREVRADPIGPGILALACAVAAAALQSLGSPGPAADPAAVGGAASPPQLLYVSAAIFALVSLLQIAFNGLRAAATNRSRTVICGACQRAFPRSSSKRCECGGHLEPISNWRWEQRDDITHATPVVQVHQRG